jgi:hypothetical protein
MKDKFLKLFIILFSVTLISSCSEDDENQNTVNPTPTASFEGSWKAEEVQILSAPTVNPGMWKPALVIWGNVQASTIGNLDITFLANGNWIASGFLTNTTIKDLVKDRQAGSSFSANGTYTKDNSSMTVVVDNYTGRGGTTTGQTTCSYSISGDKMTVTVDLPNSEKWQIIFKKQ